MRFRFYVPKVHLDNATIAEHGHHVPYTKWKQISEEARLAYANGRTKASVLLMQWMWITYMLGVILGLAAISHTFSLSFLATFPILALLFLIWLGAISWWFRRQSRPHLRRALNAHGYPVCIECGYNLTGVEPHKAHCPECGASREPLHTSGRRVANNHP